MIWIKILLVLLCRNVLIKFFYTRRKVLSDCTLRVLVSSRNTFCGNVGFDGLGFTLFPMLELAILHGCSSTMLINQ